MRPLTPDEQAKLEALNDPDVVKPKFAWDDVFQRKLLGMMLTDVYMLVQSLDKIRPEYFTHDAHVLICKLLYAYFTERRAIPEKFILHQELAEKLKDR